MNWNNFKDKNNFENFIYDIVCESFELLLNSEYKNEKFSAFAFNVNALYGDISLSFDTYLNNKEENLYPPDWDYECMEIEIKEITTLWKKYEGIRTEYEELLETEDENKLIEFSNGFLESLRKVMVRLEKNNIFSKVKTTNNFWTLVTEIDADTDKEERLLNEIRKNFN